MNEEKTLYTTIGNSFVYLAIIALCALVAEDFWYKKTNRKREQL